MYLDGKTVKDYVKEAIDDFTLPIKHRVKYGSPPLVMGVWLVPYAGYFTPFYGAKQGRIKRRREILGLEYEDYTPVYKDQNLD